MQLPSFPTTCSPPPLSFPDEVAVFKAPRGCAATADGSVVYVTEGASAYRGGWKVSSSSRVLHPAHHISSRPSAQLYALSSPVPRYVVSSAARLCSAGPQGGCRWPQHDHTCWRCPTWWGCETWSYRRTTGRHWRRGKVVLPPGHRDLDRRLNTFCGGGQVQGTLWHPQRSLLSNGCPISRRLGQPDPND